MIKLIDILNENETPELQFPDGFQPAKKVPEGGAMCANCSKWNKKTQLCEGQYYIDWHGNGKIPTNPTEYVCIWWINKIKETSDPQSGKSSPYGSGYSPVKK
jgi:hypothetical protein